MSDVAYEPDVDAEDTFDPYEAEDTFDDGSAPQLDEATEQWVEAEVASRAQAMLEAALAEAGIDPATLGDISDDWEDEFGEDPATPEMQAARELFEMGQAGDEVARDLVSEHAAARGYENVDPDQVLEIARAAFPAAAAMYGDGEEIAEALVRTAVDAVAHENANRAAEAEAQERAFGRVATLVESEGRLYGVDNLTPEQVAKVYQDAEALWPAVRDRVADPAEAARTALHEAARLSAAGRTFQPGALSRYYGSRGHELRDERSSMSEDAPRGVSPIAWKFGRQADQIARSRR